MNLLPSWLRFPRRSASRRLPTPTYRPGVEALEDRTLLTAGALDPTFGTGGLVTSGGPNVGWAVVVQADGGIVVAGTVRDNGVNDIVLERYRPDGTIDMLFGSGGRATIDLVNYDGAVRALALQQDGKIVVAGEAGTGGSNPDFMAARLNPDGSLDLSFGAAGKAITNVSTTTDTNGESVSALVIQDDGKIVLGGSAVTWDGTKNSQNFALVRFNANGALDAGFGTGGKVIAWFDTDKPDTLKGLALQTDGKIVAAGQTYSLATESADFALARFKPDGALDTSFSGDGKMTIDFGSAPNKKQKVVYPSDDGANAVVVQPDGKIVVVGSTQWSQRNTGTDFALTRITSTGTLDTTFGSGGKVVTVFGADYDEATCVALQTVNGQLKIVVGGAGRITGWEDFALARYNLNGSLDTTFGGDGKVTTHFGVAGDAIRGIAIQPDNKIVAVGYAFVTEFANDLALARYESL